LAAFACYKTFGYFSSNTFVVICILVFAANSAVDLKKTWYFYFPDLEDIYKKTQGSIQAEDRSLNQGTVGNTVETLDGSIKGAN
jgi:hypothetical protein